MQLYVCFPVEMSDQLEAYLEETLMGTTHIIRTTAL